MKENYCNYNKIKKEKTNLGKQCHYKQNVSKINELMELINVHCARRGDGSTVFVRETKKINFYSLHNNIKD